MFGTFWDPVRGPWRDPAACAVLPDTPAWSTVRGAARCACWWAVLAMWPCRSCANRSACCTRMPAKAYSAASPLRGMRGCGRYAQHNGRVQPWVLQQLPHRHQVGVPLADFWYPLPKRLPQHAQPLQNVVLCSNLRAQTRWWIQAWPSP